MIKKLHLAFLLLVGLNLRADWLNPALVNLHTLSNASSIQDHGSFKHNSQVLILNTTNCLNELCFDDTDSKVNKQKNKTEHFYDLVVFTSNDFRFHINGLCTFYQAKQFTPDSKLFILNSVFRL
jgi:hypothetical protein